MYSHTMPSTRLRAVALSKLNAEKLGPSRNLRAERGIQCCSHSLRTFFNVYELAVTVFHGCCSDDHVRVLHAANPSYRPHGTLKERAGRCYSLPLSQELGPRHPRRCNPGAMMGVRVVEGPDAAACSAFAGRPEGSCSSQLMSLLLEGVCANIGNSDWHPQCGWLMPLLKTSSGVYRRYQVHGAPPCRNSGPVLEAPDKDSSWY